MKGEWHVNMSPVSGSDAFGKGSNKIPRLSGFPSVHYQISKSRSLEKYDGRRGGHTHRATYAPDPDRIQSSRWVPKFNAEGERATGKRIYSCIEDTSSLLAVWRG